MSLGVIFSSKKNPTKKKKIIQKPKTKKIAKTKKQSGETFSLL